MAKINIFDDLDAISGDYWQGDYLRAIENQRLECKKQLRRDDGEINCNIIHSVVGMLNTHGGHIICGVKDIKEKDVVKGGSDCGYALEVNGMAKDKEAESEICREIFKKIKPTELSGDPYIEISYKPIKNTENKFLLIIHVSKKAGVEFSCQDSENDAYKVYKRFNDSTLPENKYLEAVSTQGPLNANQRKLLSTILYDWDSSNQDDKDLVAEIVGNKENIIASPEKKNEDITAYDDSNKKFNFWDVYNFTIAALRLMKNYFARLRGESNTINNSRKIITAAIAGLSILKNNFDTLRSSNKPYLEKKINFIIDEIYGELSLSLLAEIGPDLSVLCELDGTKFLKKVFSILHKNTMWMNLNTTHGGVITLLQNITWAVQKMSYDDENIKYIVQESVILYENLKEGPRLTIYQKNYRDCVAEMVKNIVNPYNSPAKLNMPMVMENLKCLQQNSPTVLFEVFKDVIIEQNHGWSPSNIAKFDKAARERAINDNSNKRLDLNFIYYYTKAAIDDAFAQENIPRLKYIASNIIKIPHIENRILALDKFSEAKFIPSDLLYEFHELLNRPNRNAVTVHLRDLAEYENIGYSAAFNNAIKCYKDTYLVDEFINTYKNQNRKQDKIEMCRQFCKRYGFCEIVKMLPEIENIKELAVHVAHYTHDSRVSDALFKYPVMRNIHKNENLLKDEFFREYIAQSRRNNHLWLSEELSSGNDEPRVKIMSLCCVDKDLAKNICDFGYLKSSVYSKMKPEDRAALKKLVEDRENQK